MLGATREGTMNEADTCRTYVLPKLKSAGWEDKYITEEMILARGCIVLDLEFKGEL